MLQLLPKELTNATMTSYLRASNAELGKNVPSDLQALLMEFGDLFEKPSTFLPYRALFNHQIPIEGAKSINKKRYKFSWIQKNIVEKLVQEMLHNGVVQHSTSPYAGLVCWFQKKKMVVGDSVLTIEI